MQKQMILQFVNPPDSKKIQLSDRHKGLGSIPVSDLLAAYMCACLFPLMHTHQQKKKHLWKSYMPTQKDTIHEDL